MGKIAKALGINVKGDATISIQKRAYRPGETVVGQVNLRIREPVDAQALVLSVVGKERLKWETTSTSHQHNKTVHTTTHHTQKLQLFSSELVVAQPKHYEPGDYVFPFQCALPLDLPPSIEFKKSSLQDMGNFRAFVNYKLAVALPVRGMLRADLGSTQLIRVLAIENIVPRSARATRSQQVELLGMFNQGVCEFTARLRSDVLRIGEAAHVRCRIQNQSKKRVRAVTSLLYQDIKVTPLQNDGGVREYTYTVNETSYPGFDAGAASEVVITPQIKADRYHGSSSEMLPTHVGNLFTIGYRMRVKCSYTMCSSTKVEFPLTIFPQ